MNAGFFDVILQAFIGALQTGFNNLTVYSLPLLGFAALIFYCTTLWDVVMHPGDGFGLSTVLMTAVCIGVWYFFTISIWAFANAALTTFMGWGATAGGGFSGEAFLSPSGIVNVGFRAAFPVQAMLLKFEGISALYNFPTVLAYMVAYWLIILAFVLVAVQMMMTLIEFWFAVLCAAILFPVGLLRHVGHDLAGFAISWFVAGLVRVFLTIALMGISLPLFDGLALTTTPGGDPTLYSAMIYACSAAVFALLSWAIPARAAAIAGRGMSLGLSGSVLLPTTGVRAVMAGGRGLIGMGQQGISGASRMIAARRGV